MPGEKKLRGTQEGHPVRRLGDLAKSCLIKFQKQHRQIPELEYGMAFSAITLWYLTQAADALHKGRNYVVDVATKPKSNEIQTRSRDEPDKVTLGENDERT